MVLDNTLRLLHPNHAFRDRRKLAPVPHVRIIGGRNLPNGSPRTMDEQNGRNGILMGLHPPVRTS